MSTTFKLKVPSLACQSCVKTVTRAIQQRDPEAQVTADPATKWVTIASVLTEIEAQRAIEAAGHLVEPETP